MSVEPPAEQSAKGDDEASTDDSQGKRVAVERSEKMKADRKEKRSDESAAQRKPRAQESGWRPDLRPKAADAPWSKEDKWEKRQSSWDSWEKSKWGGKDAGKRGGIPGPC